MAHFGVSVVAPDPSELECVLSKATAAYPAWSPLTIASASPSTFGLAYPVPSESIVSGSNIGSTVSLSTVARTASGCAPPCTGALVLPTSIVTTAIGAHTKPGHS